MGKSVTCPSNTNRQFSEEIQPRSPKLFSHVCLTSCSNSNKKSCHYASSVQVKDRLLLDAAFLPMRYDSIYEVSLYPHLGRLLPFSQSVLASGITTETSRRRCMSERLVVVGWWKVVCSAPTSQQPPRLNEICFARLTHFTALPRRHGMWEATGEGGAQALKLERSLRPSLRVYHPAGQVAPPH